MAGIFQKLSLINRYEDKEIVLMNLLNEYRKGCDPQKVLNHLLLQFKKASQVDKLLILRYLSKINQDHITVNYEIYPLLISENKIDRHIAVKFVKIFIDFYKHDDVIIYLCRKYKSILKRILDNKKYATVFSKIIKKANITEPAKGKRKYQYTYLIDKIKDQQDFLCDFMYLSSSNDVKSHHKLIFKYLAIAIKEYKSKSVDTSIPGLEMQDVSSDVTGINPFMYLELKNLTRFKLFIKIKQALVSTNNYTNLFE